MLYAQELQVLKKLNSFTKILMEVLPFSIKWEEARERASKIDQPKLLLLCEEENRAAELNQKLKEVKRKLWINPLKFKKPEDLIQLNTKMIKSYAKLSPDMCRKLSETDLKIRLKLFLPSKRASR